MADAFRGLTIRIGADSRPVQSALNSIQSSAGQAQRQINRLTRALKFDGTDAAAMNSRLSLMHDRIILSARATHTVTAAWNQASAGMRAAVERGKDFYSETQRTRWQLRGVNQELQGMHDALAKVRETQLREEFAACTEKARELKDAIKAAGKGGDVKALEKDLAAVQKRLGQLGKAKGEKSGLFMMARREVRALSDDLAKGGEAAASARQQLVRLGMALRQADTPLDIVEENNVTRARKLVSLLEETKRLHNRIAEQDATAREAEGLAAARNSMAAYRAEMRQAISEHTRFKAEMAATAATPGLERATRDLKAMDAAAEAASSSARKMKAAYDTFPTSVTAARAKVASLRAEEATLLAKTSALQEKMRQIEATPGFDRAAASASDLYVNVEKATRSFEQAQEKVAMTRAKLDQLGEEADEFAARAAAGVAGAAERFGKLQAEIEETARDLKALEGREREAEAAFNTATVRGEWRRVNDELVEAHAHLRQIRDMAAGGGFMTTMAGTLRTMGYGLYSTITPAILMAGRHAVQSAEDVDSAYRDMRKTVNGTEEEFEALRQAALEFGRTHVTSADQMLEIESIGGQLGIAVKDLESFATTVSNLDIATNMNTEDIALDLAKMSNIMHFGQEQYDSFADALVRLGNNEPALESDIMEISARFAGMAANVGMATSDMLGLATAATATGQKAEAAGGSIQRTIARIEAAVAEGGDDLEAYARVSNMTAEEFAAAWGDTANHGPIRAIQAFIGGLRDIRDNGGSVIATLDELGITGVRDRQLLSGLTNTTDVLAESVGMADDAWNGLSTTMADGSIEKAGDAAREAGKKAEGFSGQLAMMGNAAQELGAAMLDSAVPMMKAVTAALQGFTGAVSAMPDWGKSMAVKAAVAVAALGPVLVATGAVVDGLNKMSEAYKTVQAAFTMRTGYKDKIAEIDAALAKNRASIAKTVAAQERHVAELGKESAALRANKAELESQRAVLEADKAAYEAAAAGAGKFKVAVKALAATAGVMIALEAVGAVIGKLAEAAERAKDLEEASRGLSKASDEFAASARSLGSGADSQADSAASASRAVGDYSDAVDEAIERNMDLARSIRDSMADAEGNAALVDKYSDKIIELSGNCKGNAESLNLLKSYVDAYNKLTGSAVSVTDDFEGSLNVSADAIKRNAEAFKKNAYAEAAKENAAEATKAYASLHATYESLMKEKQKVDDEYSGKKAGFMNDFERADYSSKMQQIGKQLAEIEPQMQAAEKTMNDMSGEFERATADQVEQLSELEGAADSAGEGVSDLGDELEETEESVEDIAESISSLCDMYPAFSQMFHDSGLDAEGFNDVLRDMGLSMDDVASGMSEMADAVSDGFNRIEEDSEMSLQKYMENLQHNKELTEAWGDNLKALYEKSSDSTYRAWVREMADAGPKYAALVAEMASQDAATLEEEARSWQEARELGPEAYLDSIGAAAEAAEKRAAEIAAKVEGAVSALGELEIEFAVTDDGTVQVARDALEEFDLVALADKGFIVTDGGTILDMSKEVGKFRLVTIGDKHFYVTDDGTIYDEQGMVDVLKGALGSIPGEVKTYFEGDAGGLNAVIDSIQSKLDRLNASGATASGIGLSRGGHASGGVFPGALRVPAFAAGGALNGIVTRATLTNRGLVGEAGTEAVVGMGRRAAVVPLSNRRYVRPFARAVASEMGGGGGTVNNTTVYIRMSYDAGADAARIVDDIAGELKVRGLMEA